MRALNSVLYNYVQRATSVVRFYVASQRVVPCLYVFVSFVFLLTTSATSQHNTPQQVGVRIKTAPRIDKLYMLQGSLGQYILSRAGYARQVGSLPLAKNAKHSSSI